MDYLIDRSQDLADTTFQAKLHEDLKPAVFIAAALDSKTFYIASMGQTVYDKEGPTSISLSVQICFRLFKHV